MVSELGTKLNAPQENLYFYVFFKQLFQLPMRLFFLFLSCLFFFFLPQPPLCSVLRELQKSRDPEKGVDDLETFSSAFIQLYHRIKTWRWYHLTPIEVLEILKPLLFCFSFLVYDLYAGITFRWCPRFVSKLEMTVWRMKRPQFHSPLSAREGQLMKPVVCSIMNWLV